MAGPLLWYALAVLVYKTGTSTALAGQSIFWGRNASSLGAKTIGLDDVQ